MEPGAPALIETWCIDESCARARSESDFVVCWFSRNFVGVFERGYGN